MINLLSSIITTQHVSLLVAVSYIIYRILCGVMTCILLKAKGYSGMAFFLGLFGGVAAILFAIGMPTRNDRQVTERRKNMTYCFILSANCQEHDLVETIIISVICWLFCGIITASIYSSKGYSGGFWVGFFSVQSD